MRNLFRQHGDDEAAILWRSLENTYHAVVAVKAMIRHVLWLRTDRWEGFRPGRNCHDAISELCSHLYANEVEVVIDVDLANFFGTIDHGILKELLSA